MPISLRALFALPLAVLLSIGSISPSRADEVQEATQLLKQGYPTQALERINAFLAAHPKDAKGRFLKGLILAEQSKTAEAIKVFSALTEDYPELPEPYNNLAVLHAVQGQYDKAKTALEMAIRTHPSYAVAHENLGDIYAKMATQAYDRALQLDRGNAAAQTKLALIRELFSGTGKPAKPAAKLEASKVPMAAAPAAPLPPVVKPPPVAAPAPPAAKPPVSSGDPASAAKSNAETGAVAQALENWAQAWSSNNVPAYLGHYAKDFAPPAGATRSAWEATRRQLVAKPRKISVAITDLKVTFPEPNKATASFVQDYRSGAMKSVISKTLVLVKTDGKWLIQREQVGKK